MVLTRKLGAAVPILVCMLAAQPAAAQYGPVPAENNAAFAEGQDWGATPLTKGERLMCAAFWYVWSELVEEVFDERDRAELVPALTKAAASNAADFWAMEIAREEGVEVNELSEPTMASLREQMDTAWDYAEGVAYGEDHGLVRVLGACEPPPEE